MARDVEANKQALRRILNAYAQADFTPIMAALHDDVVWTSNAMPGHYRFGGRREGRAGVIEALSMIATDFAILRYEVREMTGEGDVVWAMCDLEIGERNSQTRVVLKLINRWEFRDGKIISCQEFFDTAGTLAKLGKIEPQIGIALTA